MNIEKQIEFDKVKDIWDALAVTDRAKQRIREASPFFSENELRKQLKDTTDAKSLMEKLGMPPLQNITEIFPCDNPLSGSERIRGKSGEYY